MHQIMKTNKELLAHLKAERKRYKKAYKDRPSTVSHARWQAIESIWDNSYHMLVASEDNIHMMREHVQHADKRIFWAHYEQEEYQRQHPDKEHGLYEITERILALSAYIEVHETIIAFLEKHIDPDNRFVYDMVEDVRDVY